MKMDADADLKIVSSVSYEANFHNNIQRYWVKRLVIALLAYIGQVLKCRIYAPAVSRFENICLKQCLDEIFKRQ